MAPFFPADPTREGLLAACFAEPADDLARLVFADYLEEHDQPDWAAFIRLQLAGSPRTWADRRPHAPEELRLLNAVPGSPLAEAAAQCQARRGFFRLVVVDGEGDNRKSVRELAAAMHAGMVESVALGIRYDSGMLTAAEVEALSQVGELDLASCEHGPSDTLLSIVAAELAPGTPGVRVQRVIVPPHLRNRFDKLVAGTAKHRPRPVWTRSDMGFNDPPPRHLKSLVARGGLRDATSFSVGGRLTPGVAADLALRVARPVRSSSASGIWD